jgi:hypothetical protein
MQLIIRRPDARCKKQDIALQPRDIEPGELETDAGAHVAAHFVLCFMYYFFLPRFFYFWENQVSNLNWHDDDGLDSEM